MKLEYSVEKPLNREPPVETLIQSFLSIDDQYDRNHGPIPYIDVNHHFVHVDGNVRKKLQLSVHQLKNQFPQYEVISALQCAGNRRHTMRTLLKEVNGIDWGEGAVMNCSWKGPRLKDILLEAGLTNGKCEGQHAAFSCFQTAVQGDDWYGGSVELGRAMDEDADILIALEMNGKPLTAKHGYPVRIIVPGVSGCRSVKWLDRITVQSEESTNLYQRYDYKILPPEATDAEAAKKYWDITPALQDMPVNSVIATPQDGDTIRLSPDGTLEVRGYALPHGNQGPVVNVEISIDDGRTWSKAEIMNTNREKSKWAWAIWKANVNVEKGREKRLLSRATDAGENIQNDNPGKWNLRGVAYDGYGEVRGLNVT
ncbi:hypothetical protein ACLMJK_001247 [Lecanora helva]